MSNHQTLTRWICIGLVAGLLVGQFLFDPTWNSKAPLSEHNWSTTLGFFEFFGFTVFMALLKVLIIPLIAASVFVAVTSVGDFAKLGKLGAWALVFYFSTMFVAVVIGLAVVCAIEPGASLRETMQTGEVQPTVDTTAIAERAAGGLPGVFSNLVRLMLPTNIFNAMAEGQTLSVIVFFIFFGVVATLIGERAKPLVEVGIAANEVLMRMVTLVLYLAPLGVFCLLAWTVARIGLGVFGESIGIYMFCVISGLAIHATIVLPAILWLFTRQSPWKFFLAMREAVFMATGTASSSATLPVTLSCAENAGVRPRVAGLVFPLGATINMDGTALYEAVAVVFMAQAAGIELGGLQLCLIAITATLAAVGAAGIPSAGLVTMFIVLDAVNNSLQSVDPNAQLIPIAAIGLIFGVDRILDMLRTGVNVWGDSVGAKVLNELDSD